MASASAYSSSLIPNACATLTFCPSPGVPMKSSAVKARISATVDEIRRPVAMYGTAARQRDPVEPLQPAEPEGARRVEGERVDVADAVHRLHEQRPEGAEGGQEDLALQVRAERQEEQRDQGRRRDRAQELDRDPERARGERARAERDPDRHRQRGRDAEAERPAADGLPERLPERARLEELPELLHGRRHRRHVLGRDDAAPHGELPEPQRRRDREQRHERVGRAPQPHPRACLGGKA